MSNIRHPIIHDAAYLPPDLSAKKDLRLVAHGEDTDWSNLPSVFLKL